MRRRLARACGAAAVLVGVLVLAGWAGDARVLKSVRPGLATMKPNSALAFALAGLSLWALPATGRAAPRRRLVGRGCGVAVCVVAGLTLVQYAFGLDLGIDQLLFRESPGSVATPVPGRMSPITALVFLLLGSVLLLRHTGYAPLGSQALNLLAILVSFLCCLSYLYGTEALRPVAPFSSMAMHTAVTFLVLSVGLFIAPPAAGLAALLASDGIGGVLVRRLLPAAVVVPVLVGWLGLAGQRAGWYGTEFGLAAFALATITIFTALVCWTASRVQRADGVRRRAEESVRASEERFRAVVDASPSGLLVVNQAGTIILANGPLERMFGYARDEFLGRPVEQLIPERHRGDHPAQRSHYFTAPQARAMGGGRDLWGVRKDGSEVPVEVGLNPVTMDDGLHALASVVDVSTRRAAEAALRESEANFRQLADAMPQIVWTARPDGHIDYYNERWYGYTGASKAATGDESWAPALHPDDRQRCFDVWYAAVRSGHPYEIEYRFKNGTTGEYRWRLGRALPVRDPAGRIVRWFGTGTDIHDKKRVEEELTELNATLEKRVAEQSAQALEQRARELRHQTRLMESILNGIAEGVVVADETGKFLVFNPAAERLLGTGTTAAAPADWSQAYHVFLPDGRTPYPAHLLPLARAVRGEPTDEVEMVVRNPTKAADSTISVTSRPLPADDGAGGGVSVFHDITARKQVEEQTRAALREKEVLLKEIHHRVKNNLQIVSALLDLQSAHTQDRQAAEMFTESRGRVKSMALIHERLYRSQDLARVDFAEYVRQLVDDLFRTYKVSSDEVGVDVTVDVPPLPIDIAIPCGLLLNELISNSLKHGLAGAPAGGIRVALTRAGDGRNVLSVADTGVGFPRDLDFRNTSSFGLQLVNTLVGQLRGEIALNTDRGTEFAITFPASDPRPNGPVA